MTRQNQDEYYVRRTAHERARQRNQTRIASVLGAHGALYTSIRSGTLPARSRLDEMQLSAMFSMSRNSIRGALRLLAEEGLVSRAPRIGTAVANAVIDVPLNTGTWWGQRPAGEREVVVTDERWVASTPITRYLLQTTSDRVHVSEKVASYGGQPALMYTRFSLVPAASNPARSSTAHQRFRSAFETIYGSPLATIDCWIEAKCADERSATRLGLPVATPLIVKSRVLTSADGVPREYSITHYRASMVAMSGALDENLVQGVVQEGEVDVSRLIAHQSVQPATDALRRRSSPDLHTELRAAIREGIFRVGDRLSEDELADLFGAGRNTVRLVLAQLTDEGIVHRSRRQGTMIIARIADNTVDACTPFRPEERRLYRSERLTSTQIATPPFIAELLQTASPRVAFDEHLIYRDQRPTSVFIRYTSPEVRSATTSTFEDYPTAFELTYGAPPRRRDVYLHAVKTPSPVAQRLGVRPGAPLLLVERLLHDADGRPREFSHTYHAAAHITLASHHRVTPAEPAAA